MKIKVGFLCMLMLAGAVVANAQGQGGMRRTAEERTKRVVDTITTVLKLDAAVQTQVQGVFMDYNKAMDKLREGGQRPERSEFEKLSAERDEKLKKVLTADQYKKYKDEIEPAMRPRRQQQ